MFVLTNEDGTGENDTGGVPFEAFNRAAQNYNVNPAHTEPSSPSASLSPALAPR
jgi:hypothetical protein